MITNPVWLCADRESVKQCNVIIRMIKSKIQYLCKADLNDLSDKDK
jgi:hypothetical protein